MLLQPEPEAEKAEPAPQPKSEDPGKPVGAGAPVAPSEPATSSEAQPPAPAPDPEPAKSKREKASTAIDSARSNQDPEATPVVSPETGEIVAREAFKLLGTTVSPGTTRHLKWRANAGSGSLDESTPVLVVHGVSEGPVLCLTAAVHGDEINGIDIVRRIVHGLDAKELKGTVVGVPIVNLPGFQRGSRYLPDRRDLNRYFPGNPKGSLAARIAHSFFQNIVLGGCHILVDVHTGSFHRTNLPQLRADLRDQTVADMAHGLGEIAVLQSVGARGTLRRAATEAGVPALTVEAGEPLRLQPSEVAQGVKGIQSLMSHLGMTRERRLWRIPQPIYYDSRWLRVQRGGILFSKARLGDRVKVGDVLGAVIDPISNLSTDVVATQDGRVLGRALNQFVMPGFAAFHIGIESSQEQLVSEILPVIEPESTRDDEAETLEADRPERLTE